MEYQFAGRRKIYEDVRDFMVGEIVAGRLPTGKALPSERELMERFGIGRPAIREALLSLQQMGLVRISNGERAQVVEPSAPRLIAALTGAARYYLSDNDGMRQFQSARLHFEISMTRLAAAQATDRQIGLLELALKNNQSAIGKQAAFEKTDIDFHMEIVKISANDLLIGVYQALRAWLMEQVNVVSKIKGTHNEAVESHTEIFEAIRARDSDGAERAMCRHLTRVAERYWESKERRVLNKKKQAVD